MKTYFISGLGADKRIYSELKLHKEVEMIHLPWIHPEKNESLTHYAMRMAEKIADPAHSAMVGTSFGGVMAVEIRKHLTLGKTVLLSSVKHRGELSPGLRLIGWSGIHKLVPPAFIFRRRNLVHRFFGTDTPNQRALLNAILDVADPDITRWSIDRLVTWANDTIPEVIHIHGTADIVFPKNHVKADHWIAGGPHFMVLTHAREVSDLLNKVLLDQ